MIATTVTLLAVNPRRLHVYWHPAWRGARPAKLRVYDLADGALDGATALHGYAEVEVRPQVSSCYIEVTDTAICCAELGYRDGRGRWVALGTSNVLFMPGVDEPAPVEAAAPPEPLPPSSCSR